MDKKNSPNIAIARLKIYGAVRRLLGTSPFSDTELEIIAFSGYTDVDGYARFVQAQRLRQQLGLPANIPSKRDLGSHSEVKILAEILGKTKPDTEGKLILFTERPPCGSCTRAIIRLIKLLRPNIEVQVFHLCDDVQP